MRWRLKNCHRRRKGEIGFSFFVKDWMPVLTQGIFALGRIAGGDFMAANPSSVLPLNFHRRLFHCTFHSNLPTNINKHLVHIFGSFTCHFTELFRQLLRNCLRLICCWENFRVSSFHGKIWFFFKTRSMFNLHPTSRLTERSSASPMVHATSEGVVKFSPTLTKCYVDGFWKQTGKEHG
jgi:hypothetical protein